MKKITVLGSTGSVGKQTLDVVRKHVGEFKIVALSCNNSYQLLLKQIDEFKPEAVCVYNKDSFLKLKTKVGKSKVQVFCGQQGLNTVACWPSAEMVVISLLGAVGIEPTLKAIKAGKDIALATKEVMVAAGDLITKEAIKHNVKIIPVDSEHSAIFQCLEGGHPNEINKIYLTCSGGPFRGKTRSSLRNISVNDALNHPKWKMGAKISIDSATLMNKGLEVIEAMKLFGLNLKQVEVIVHPQSIIHSMVEFVDGNILAQVGPTDMRFAIRHALSYPKRLINHFEFLNPFKTNKLTFEKPDIKTFKCLSLALKAAQVGGTMPAVLNAANEVAVEAFLDNKISFLGIPGIVEQVINQHQVRKNYSFDGIIKADRWARKAAFEETNNV